MSIGRGRDPGRLVHKRTDSFLPKCKDRYAPEKRPDCGEDHMLFVVGVVIVSIAAVVIPRLRVPSGVDDAPLGWMSEQWLAEHRASHRA